MDDVAGPILTWLVPAAIVLGATLLVIAALVWAVRRSRRSARARAAAEAARRAAGAALVRLDDAVTELDLEVGLSGALQGGGAPVTLRRARLTGQHARDEAFDEYLRIGSAEVLPAEIRRSSLRIAKRADEALRTISNARAEHAAWVAANVSAASQVASAQQHLTRLRETMGDPAALVAELSARFAEDEWREASRAAHAAVAEADEAERLLARAAEHAADPARALVELSAAERALRQSEADARILEESHRLVMQAAQAVPGEIDAARTALRQASVVCDRLDGAAAERLRGDLGALERELDEIETDASRRPSRTVDRIARLRERLDVALGDTRTAQQRVRGSRTALPGTLAAARSAIAQAEASAVHAGAGADARARLISSQRELAAARQAQDPVSALAAARRALRDADDARSLADAADHPSS
ncbi:hypothetical protein ACFUTX_09960 [Microbacterium sp. NPDC057407]|uniref:hypothetical protein n=1 Tax=Microbacterium sp. NPDC057407 TaxID=3346120 RepID=UPI0036728835